MHHIVKLLTWVTGLSRQHSLHYICGFSGGSKVLRVVLGWAAADTRT